MTKQINGCCCPDWYCELPTPQSIYDDSGDEERDVFWEILEYAGFTAQDYIVDLDSALWDRFRYHMLNGCSSVEVWEQMMKDKARSLYKKYKAVLDEYAQLDQMDLEASHTQMVTENENELLPDTPVVEGDKYLSSRSKTEQNIHVNSDLNALTFRAAKDSFVDPYEDFAREFDALFLNRW